MYNRRTNNMRTIRKKIYKFKELSESAKEKARSWYRSGQEFFGQEDYLLTLKEGLKHFRCKLNNYNIDYDNFSYDVKIDFPIGEYERTRIKDLKGIRLWKYLQNNLLLTKWTPKGNIKVLGGNCPFTGMAADEDFLDNIREFVKLPKANITFEDLINESVCNLIRSGSKEWEYQQSNEAVDEVMEANEYEFLANGTYFN